MSHGSSHNSANYLLRLASGATDAVAFLADYTLTGVDSAAIRTAMIRDANHYVYNSISSYSLGIASIVRGEYAWATVKLYYSAYYSTRALLALHDRSVFYAPNHTGRPVHMSVHGHVGRNPKREKQPSTHKLVCRLANEHGCPAFLNGQEIEGLDGLSWLASEREHCQYRSARFEDPDLPKRYLLVVQTGIQRILQEYFADTQHLYTFDPAHAMVALPTQLMLELVRYNEVSLLTHFNNSDRNYLQSNTRCGRLTLSSIRFIINAITR